MNPEQLVHIISQDGHAAEVKLISLLHVWGPKGWRVNADKHPELAAQLNPEPAPEAPAPAPSAAAVIKKALDDSAQAKDDTV